MRADRPLSPKLPPSMNDADAAQVAKALSHPLRIELVRAMREDRLLSPVGYSRESGEPLGNVSYHVRELLSAEIVALAEIVPRGGAMKHYYELKGRRAKIVLSMLDLLAGA
jgi:DNA-binding transcriptional ArsR family regulator